MRKNGRLKSDQPVISLRAVGDLRDRLIASAEAGSRSLSRECEMRLEASFTSEPAVSPDLRTIIREEIRAAMGPARKPCGREQGAHCPNHPPFAHQCACEGMHTISGFQNTLGASGIDYAKALHGGLTQTYDRSALSGKQ